MNDKTTTLQQLKDISEHFVKERDWQQFHSPKNASMALTREASELMEIFQWCTTEQSHEIVKEKREAVEHELADVLMWLCMFSWENNIDLAEAFTKKLEHTKAKYPIEKCKGLPKKYTEL